MIKEINYSRGSFTFDNILVNTGKAKFIYEIYLQLATVVMNEQIQELTESSGSQWVPS